MRRTPLPSFAVACLLAGLCAAGSCVLNPQPEPPGDSINGTGAGGENTSTTTGSATSGGGGSIGTGGGPAGGGGSSGTGVDAAAPPTTDAGANAEGSSDSAVDGSSDAPADGAVDGSEGSIETDARPIEAGDATLAPGD
jgi:hypothetical protein